MAQLSPNPALLPPVNPSSSQGFPTSCISVFQQQQRVQLPVSKFPWVQDARHVASLPGAPARPAACSAGSRVARCRDAAGLADLRTRSRGGVRELVG